MQVQAMALSNGGRRRQSRLLMMKSDGDLRVLDPA